MIRNVVALPETPYAPTRVAAEPPATRFTAASLIDSLVTALASLKLTVALFAMAIFIILVGTLAQVNQDMWEVISQYFRAKIAWIHASVFFPRSWFPNLGDGTMRALVAFAATVGGFVGAIPCFARREKHWLWPIAGFCILVIGGVTAAQSLLFGGFFFPGGATIGGLLAVNLLVTHSVRFTFQARGLRLALGLAVIAIGALLTWLVIASGHNKEGLQAEPIVPPVVLWLWCKTALTAICLTAGALAAHLAIAARHRIIELVLTSSIALLLTPLCIWLWWAGDRAYLGDAGMRIMWQLIQGGFAGVVLLVGCILAFKRRGSIVLIHAGLGLMMAGEWFVSYYAAEERLIIREGETADFAIDIRTTELAVIDPAYSATQDDVVVVPGSLLLTSAKTGQPVQHPDLPFDVQVVEYYKNSDLRPVQGEDKNLATAGHGQRWIAVPTRGSSGADSSGKVDVASAYVRLLDKGSGKTLGTYLVSQLTSLAEKVPVGPKTYDLALRFKHKYKPYSMQLIDVRKVDYVGTTTPKDYSSYVRLIDPSRNEDRKIRIWMNNPLRYAGETFYQSGYDKNERGVETTTLQVVKNTGWMIPYVACMLVGIGMVGHFVVMLVRFLKRRDEALLAGTEVVAAEVVAPAPAKSRRIGGKKRREQRPQAAAPASRGSWSGVVWPAAIVIVCGIWVGTQARPQRVADDGFDLAAFATLPVADRGRVKPIDALVRTTLTGLSDRDYYKDADGKKQPAIRWFLDSIARPAEAEKHAVFRIYNLEVLETLGLERRKGFRYSLTEIRHDAEKLAEFDKQVREASGRDAEQLSFYQRKLLEVSERFHNYMRLTNAFQPWDIPPFPNAKELEGDRQNAINTWIRRVMEASSVAEQEMARTQAPLAVPMLADKKNKEKDSAHAETEQPWQAYATAYNRSLLRKQVLGQEADPAVAAWGAIFDAYRRGDAKTFNAEVTTYRERLTANPPAEYSRRGVGVEAYYNHVAPFSLCCALYLTAFLWAAFAWLGWSRSLNRTAFWLVVLAFCVHTFAVVARIYISGRPPVTNLYSSAVFIAWICVLTGLALEAVFRFGLGNVVASVGGYAALLIAQYLGKSGDTFTVMQAVLDTQFWLATHVVFIAIGYAATFVAGLLGLIYILRGFFTPALTEDLRKTLTRAMYGVLGFATIFSLIGTVLGGLWADDSWGRFWGWDPKENGALIIVLWNALVLHARWGGMIRERGLAVLAIGGNIVTSWSWFGVNELGVGLHSYGFTEGVLLALGLFVASQLALIGVGCLPKRMWTSFRGVGDDADQVVTAEAVS